MTDEGLICRYLSNDCTPKEKLQIKQWLNNSSQHRLTMNEYNKIWQLSAISEHTTEVVFNAQKGWTRLQEAISKINFKKEMNGNKNYKNADDFPSRIRKFLNTTSII